MSRRKLHQPIRLLSLILGISSIIVVGQLLIIRPVLAQKNDNHNKVVKINDLDQKISILDQKISALDHKMSNINLTMAKTEVELCAAEKLVEISEKNLTAPNYMNAILIGLTVVLGGLAIFIVRNGIIKDIESKIQGIHNKETEYLKTIASMKDTMKVIENDHYSLLAFTYHAASFEEWHKGRVNQAIELCEKAVNYSEKIYKENPEDLDIKHRLHKFRSNLAYFYVDDARTEKTGIAIKFAKMGLETGLETDDLNLIDNFLYVVMNFSKALEDQKEWVRIFEIYRDRIFEANIREEGKEQEIYNSYYKEVKEKLAQKI